MQNNTKKIKQAVILAGGLGKRLIPFTENNPKPMFPIHDIPFIEYLIYQIKSFGIYEIVILLGYLPDKIINYLGDGKKYDLNIKYSITPVEYETQNRLKSVSDILNQEFLLMYCDNICPIDFKTLTKNFYSHDAYIELSVYSNDDNYTKDNIKIDSNNKVISYDKSRTSSSLKGVDIGYAIVSKNVLNYFSDKNENFESVVYPKLVNDGKIYATITKHRYYSIGSFERIELTKEFLSNKKYIFLDRDGTLNINPNKYEYVCKPDEFKWIDGSKEAIKKLNDAGYVVIIITNQAGIARGMMTEKDFELVQKKVDRDLLEIGAHIDDVFYCPHGWDDNCECRKPKPGLIYKAQKKYSINLVNSIMIGDEKKDMETAHNANMKCVLVNQNYKLINAVDDLLKGKINYSEV